MKVLINDGLNKEGVQIFEAAGMKKKKKKKKKKKDVIKAGAKGNLRIIGRSGVGVDNVDVNAASDYGIIVKNAPYGNTNSTAQFTMGLIYAAARNIPQAHMSLKNGVWKRKSFEGVELSNMTLGILGCGRIGQRLAELFREHGGVIGYDPKLERIKSAYPDSRIQYLSKDEVIAQSDFLSVHVGGNGNVIGERELSLMKPGSYLINAARGGCVDEGALYNALNSRSIRGAALDVHSFEPEEGGVFSSIFTSLDNVVLTSHLGASTPQAQRKTSVEIARVVTDYLLKGDFTNAVNVGETIEAEKKPVYPLFIHHRDAPGAFADIARLLSDNNINIRENPSRQVGTNSNGKVITVYLVHQMVPQPILDKLKGMKIVYSAKM